MVQAHSKEQNCVGHCQRQEPNKGSDLQQAQVLGNVTKLPALQEKAVPKVSQICILRARLPVSRPYQAVAGLLADAIDQIVTTILEKIILLQQCRCWGASQSSFLGLACQELHPLPAQQRQQGGSTLRSSSSATHISKGKATTSPWSQKW